MKIFGKGFSEYVRFEKIILLLIAVVGIGRLAISLAGVPNSTARWVSITAVSFLGLLYVSIRVHPSGKDNIFSAPEFSPAGNGRTWGHVIAHVAAGFVILPLLGWLVGSVILWVTKKVSAKDTGTAANQGA
jgi:uncharacterized Tic20 family protein